MNKIILLGNVTRNPKTTRKKSEDGTEIVITKFDLAVSRCRFLSLHFLWKAG